MLRMPKSYVRLLARKVLAFAVAYCIFATSVWSLALPIDGRSTSPSFSTSSLVGLPAGKELAAKLAAGRYDMASVDPSASPKAPFFFTNAPSSGSEVADDGVQSSSCTIRRSQPTSEGEDRSDGEHDSYARHDYKYDGDDGSQDRGPIPPIVASGATVFGPQTYVRTRGAPNDFTSVITLPQWIAQPLYLHVINGDGKGNYRVSSATISVNGVTLLSGSAFSQQVASADCVIQLTSPSSTLRVDLESKPGSFLTITALGQSQDHTPPVLTIAAPLANSAINTPQAHLDVQYQDLCGPGEPAASGVDTTTLQVLLDGTDRTSLFTKRANEATADLPASLALTPGPHTLTASIKDFAGNIAQATSQFQVDTTPPTVQILQPASGAYVGNAKPLLQVAYSDNFGVNIASLKVTINGADQSAQFTKTATGASAAITLPQGPNSVVATISDLAGNQSSASAAFNVDTTPPTVNILHPLPASVHGSGNIQFSVQFTDDQAIDLSSAQVSVDGAAVPFTTTATLTSGSVTLTDGNHNLTASIKDKAGNPGSASISFSVDTTAPDIRIVQPASGALLNKSTPSVVIQVGSALDLDPSTFKVTIDGTDQTASFPLNGLTASGTAPPLADGPHTISAQIAKVTGKSGQAQIGFVTDTIPPQVTIDPIGFTNNPTPAAVVRYSDSGSGVNLSTLHVLVDGVDVTGSFSVGPGVAQGVLSSGLTEGTHSIQATIADKAGNVSLPAPVSFTVDFTPPTAAFTTPVNNSFINTTQPVITLTYSDSGSGVDVNSVHIFLQQANQPETEITSLFSVAASQATAAINSAGALSAGTYHLRAQVGDRAGNQAAPTSAFVIDITPPTYTIVSPAANAFLNTATPSFLVTYQDDNSGVDPAKFALRVDGIDQTGSVVAKVTGASGVLPLLADGTHQVEVTVVDRAGNTAAVVPQSFLVDTIPPTINITSPASGSFTNNKQFPIAVSYADAGSGLDGTTFKVLIDGVDNTAAFTATAVAATGAPTAPLADGPHTITVSISDLAGNPATTTTNLIVDTIPPQITITQPAAGGFTNATSAVVTGTVVDASPVTVTVEGTGVPMQGANFTSAGITLNAGPVQVIHVVATDAAGNISTATATVNIDRTPPTISGSITPAPNAAGWNNGNVTVTFTCADDSSGVASCSDPVNVIVEGANQAVIGKATDQAGNIAQTSVMVNIDKTPPLLTGTPAPVPNAAGWNTTDVTITYVCSDSLSGIADSSCPLPRVVTTEGKAEQITASVSDRAGNSTSTTVTLNIEKTGPSITASVTPTPNAAGWNNSDATVSFICSSLDSDIVACSPAVTVTTEGKAQAISGSVTDQSGRTASTSATVNLDKTPPLITGSPAPAPNAAGWNNTNVTVSYVCSDSLSGIASCPPPTTVSAEGSGQKISGQATDIAGNTATVNTALNIDKTPPTITVSSAPPPNAAGWNNTNVTVNYSCTDNLSGVASCPSSTVVATEGQNQNINAQATDVAGNVATGTVSLSIDKTPPTIVQLSTPDSVSHLHPGLITVTANDNFTVAQVIISVNGSTLGTFTTAPYQTALQVPAGANPGDTLSITAQATDQAGNTQTSTRVVRVAADGVVVGQVLSDATSLTLKGATVQAISRTSSSDQTDDHGRYSLQVSDSHLFLSVSSSTPPTTTVEREVFVQDNMGTVPVDARLTPLAPPVTIGSAGGTLTAGQISITVPVAAVGDGTSFQLTPLSGQGLPGLLPLGWSPLAAFDLRSSSSATNLAAAVAQAPNMVSHLVTYNPALHAWIMVAGNQQAVNGNVNLVLPSLGAYALVVPDVANPPVPVPDPGAALTGISLQLLDPAASSSGSLSPAVLPPSGGTSTATLGVTSATFVPSGTVIEATISEKFSLKSGDVVSEENRSEDIVLYNALAPANSSIGAQFVVTPSHKFANAELLTGTVHLDILAGREGARGQPGGSDPVTTGDGVATLSVPGGALGQDTAISVQSITLEDFIPSTTSLSALQEVLVDFSGNTLNTPAQLSISATGLNPADTFLLTQVQRIDGVPHITVVAQAQIIGASLISVASPGLAGLVAGGEYVFYDIVAPAGFVQGVVSSSAGPVRALVQTDSLPIVSITGANGRYIVPAIAGTANLKASAPHTNLIGSASVLVTAGQTAQADISLSGSVTRALVSPADGALGVPSSTVITITTTAPLNPQSISQSNLILFKGAGSGAPLPLQPFVLSTSGTVLSFAPVNNLDPATQYTVQVSGLADSFGGAVVVPVSSFITKAVAPLNFDPNSITFSIPDANGNIHVSAPAGSLPPGTKVMIVDQTNAVVLSLTALNDGSLSGDFPGTVNDVLQVTATDPNGATASFTRSQFVAADGSVAVGPGGGTVSGPGGVELRIPDGALDKAATFKIESFGPDLFPERPDLAGGNFGGGLKIHSADQPVFKKEVRLAFPMPADAPPGAFFQVYRRLQGPNNQFAFEDLDYALVEGQGPTAKIVTASFPYRGLQDLNSLFAQDLFQGLSLGGTFGGSAVQGGLDNYAIAIWTFDSLLPGISLGGAVTGRVRYPVPAGGILPDGTINKTGDTVFASMSGVVVAVDGNTSTHSLGTGTTTAITQSDGSFTFSDRNYRGGTIGLIAYAPTGITTATAIEAVSLTDKTVNDYSGPLLRFYRNVAFADIVVLAPTPPPPTPQIGISLFTEDPGSTPPGNRVPVNGIIAAGTSLVIAFKTSGQITDPPSVRINSTSYASQKDQPTVPGDPNTLDFELSQAFTPTPGIYTLTATGLTPFLKTISASKNFLVVAAGGNNNSINVGVAPIIAGVTPQAGAIGVPVTTLVQVLFSEPVTNLPGHVSLVPDDGSIPPVLRLSGINYRDGITVIGNLSSTDAVSSMTIQPSELRFGTHYTLHITSDVIDLDNVADPTKPALQLVQPPAPFDFTTFGPTVLGTTTSSSSIRPVVFGNRAYVAVPIGGIFSQLTTYDVSDPTSPQLLPDSTVSFAGRPMDLAGEQTAEVINNGTLLAVASGYAASTFLMPSNLWLYDVTTDQITRVGGISVTSSAVNVGQILRVALHGNFAYTSTFPVGINVVDLQQGITEYKSVFNTNPTQFGVEVTTDGQGFANDAVVNTIPVKDSTGLNVMMLGIQAGDFVVAGSDPLNPVTQTLVVATGRVPGVPAVPISFVVADPTQPGPSALLYSGQLQWGNFALTAGVALALGQLNSTDSFGNTVSKPIAVVVGWGIGPDLENAPQTTTNVMAVVDMTVPSTPQVLSVRGLSTSASDVLLKDNLAIVGEAGKTQIFDLTDPKNPFLAGTIDGVGGSLALNGFLYSSSYANGFRIATLGALAFVKSFDPKIIVVSPASELFDNVRISYGIIPPDPSITQAEVHIDVQNGARTATLPGILSSGNGSVLWPSGAKVPPSNAYFATVHATLNGSELPTTSVRVPLVGVALAVAPRDRMLRIQFALPDQKLFVDSKGNPIDKYSVQVFLNGDGSGSPAFTVSSSDIDKAYVNEDAWFSTTADGTGVDIQDGTAQGTQAWVTRKIDKFSQPIGLNSPIRMQAFEIGTVLAQPSVIFVRVVSDKTGKEVQHLQATPSTEDNWSQIIDKVAGYVDENPTPTQVFIAGVLDNAGMIFRALQILDEASQEFQFGVLQGLLDGFKDGAEGDANMVGSLFDAVRHPVKTAKNIAQFLGQVAKSLGQVHFKDVLNGIYSSVGGVTWPTLNQVPMLANKAGYYFGYLCGFVVEQVLSAIILAVVGAGVGAIAEKVLAFLKGFGWIANLAKEAAALLKVMGYWLEVLATAAADSKAAKGALAFLRESKAFVVAVTDKYPAADKLLKAVAKTWQVSAKLASKTMEWLTIVNKMQDAAAEGFVNFLFNKGETDSEALMSRWLGLANGKRSVADAAEAYDGFATLSEGAADALTTAAEQVNSDTVKYTKPFADKYKVASDGDRVGSSLSRLRPAFGDAKYTDEAIGDAVKLNSDAAVVEMSDDAIEETAAVESHVPCTLIASVAFSIPVGQPCGKGVIQDWYQAFGADAADMGPKLKKALEQLKALNDPDLESKISKIANAARVNPDIRAQVVRAIGSDAMSTTQRAAYFKSADRMQKDGSYISGFLDRASTPTSTANIANVGNLTDNANALGHAYEPVAMTRMIDGPVEQWNNVTQQWEQVRLNISESNINEMGTRVDVSDLVNRQTIEKDFDILNGVSVDMKHSINNTPGLDSTQLAAVEAAIINKRIPEAWYVGAGRFSGVASGDIANVAAANARIKQAFGLAPDAPDFIKLFNAGPY